VPPGCAWEIGDTVDVSGNLGGLAMKKRRASDPTQWAAQFAVASELYKRGYRVAFTLGNQPAVDLMVRSPTEKLFKIDVKGL
jgi:hypothetical protein